MKNFLFKINQFFLLRILIRTSKSDPDPVKSRPDPQHCSCKPTSCRA